MVSIDLKRVDDAFAMEATDSNGHTVRMDTGASNGGNNSGASPMQLLLMALGGCSAIDVIDILKKQRQTISDYKMKVNAEREKDKTPALWETAEIEFYIYGNVEPQKAKRAVELSMDKYCSVAATLLKSGTKLSWKTFVNDQPIKEDNYDALAGEI